MIQTCLNHRQMTYDFCRDCRGRDIECPEYLADIEYSRQTKQRSSTPELVKDGENRLSLDKTAEKPFYLGHVDLMRETVLPKVNARIFLSRFRRSEGQ